MKIGFISQWYDPEGGSAAIPGAMVRSLESLGHEVDVVTGFPNYPHGQLYEGYRLRPMTVERLGKTRVHRVPLYPSHDRSAVRRAANFLSYAVSAATLGASRIRSVDVSLVYSTPATVGLAGLAVRRIWRRPFVLFIQDLWPDTVLATGMLPDRTQRVVESMLHRFCNRVYREAARVVVISPSMRDLLVERGVPSEQIDLVYNWVDEEVFKPDHSLERQPSDNFDIMYAGSIGDVQGLEVAVEAMAHLADLPDVRLRLVGGGVASVALRELAVKLGVRDRVIFEGPQPLQAMPAVMRSADVQLVCLKDLPLFRATMPSKMQAILACGLPVIVSAPGDAGSLGEASGAGLACPPGDPAALAAAIRRLHSLQAHDLAAMGTRGRDFYERELSSAVGSLRLEDSLERAKATLLREAV